jgi:hypothetical protein
MLNAVSDSDDAVDQMLVEGRRQLFLTSAQGKYLVDLASQYGFSLPRNAGFDTTGIRNLAIPAVFLPKQTAYTANRIIETFYSVDVLHPSFLSTVGAPFDLQDGDNLILQTLSGQVEIVFRASQVADIHNVTAGEIAGMVNSQQQLVFADTYYNRVTNDVNVRLTSFAYGANALLKVVGGTAQNVLRFPEIRNCYGDSTTVWSVTKEQNKVYAGRVTFTYVSGTQPRIWELRTGDVVSIRGLVDVGLDPFSTLNGSYSLLDVGQNYFVLQNLQFSPPSLPVTLTQPTEGSFIFTSSRARSLYDNQEWALVTETRQNELDVSIPVVPPVIKRTLKGSGHLHGVNYPVLGLTRNSVTVRRDDLLPTTGDFVFSTAVFSRGWDREHRLQYSSVIHGPTTSELFLTAASRKFPFMSEAESNAVGGAGIVNPVLVKLNSSEAVVTTHGVEHGFENGQEMSASNVGFSVAGNPVLESRDGGLAESDFNKNHIVKRVIDKYSYVFDLKDSNGVALHYDGTVVTSFNVHTIFDPTASQPNVRLEFASPIARAAAGFVTGMSAQLIETGTILNSVVMKILADIPMTVVSQDSSSVYLKHPSYFFTATVATNTKCRRDGTFGDADFRHWLVPPFGATPGINRDTWFENSSILLLTAQQSTNERYVGSFIYDPVGTYSPFVVSAVACQLISAVKRNQSPGRLEVTGLDGFPESGEIFVDYGVDSNEGPIQYIAIEGTGPYYIVLNKAYVFQKTHKAAAECRLSRSNRAITMKDDGSQYPVYLTGVTKARVSIETVLKSLVATGVKINITARPPDLRYVEESIDPWA